MFKTKAQLMRGKPRVPVEGLFCNYSHRICMQTRLEGFDYCIKHILEDKNSPYKQCNYMSNRTGKRCLNAAPKADKKDGYCADHARRTAILRQRAGRKRRPQETPETILEEIEHYGTTKQGDGGLVVGEVKRIRGSMDTMAHRILDYASSSDSDNEAPLVDQAWRGDGDSDAESIDSEQEDPLKHAGVYTAEEVALITRDKLIRLQSLYIDQFKRLQHVHREKRRKFLHTYRQERETLGSVHAAKDDTTQKDKYDKLMALKKYHRRHGGEALLHRQSKERRIAVSEGVNYKPPAYTKCCHAVGGNRCNSRVVPLSKYCTEHVLHDQHQVLYRGCGYGEGSCTRPVPITNINPPRCDLHTQLGEFKSRLPVHEDPLEDNRDSHIDVVNEDFKLFDDSDDQPLSRLLKQEDEVSELPPAQLLENDDPNPTPMEPQKVLEAPVTEPGEIEQIELISPIKEEPAEIDSADITDTGDTSQLHVPAIS